jgi:HSP20 family protein
MRTLEKTDGKTKELSRQNLMPDFSNFFDGFLGSDFMNRDLGTSVPAVNIFETADNFNIELSAPGYKKNELKIEVDNGILSISGEHKTESSEENKTFSRKEFNYGSFKRSFNLPDAVDGDKIDAKYEDGILKVIMAKKDEAKPKPVREIKLS